jgi:hypothetical protein
MIWERSDQIPIVSTGEAMSRRKSRRRADGGIHPALKILIVFFVLGVALILTAACVVGGYFWYRAAVPGGGGPFSSGRPRDRLVGHWECIAVEKPDQTIVLNVSPTVFGMSIRGPTSTSDEDPLAWEVTEEGGDSIKVRLRRTAASPLGNDGRMFEWQIEFVGNDRIRVTTLTAQGAPVRVYDRK